MTDLPPETKNSYQQNFTMRQERRLKEIKDITFFIIDRVDGSHDLTFPSLQRLTDRDLAWLAAAVANC
jgi:hypothetical protein